MSRLDGDVVAAARHVLGRRLRSTIGGDVCEVLILEVEAYGGVDDPASHAASGRTRRNASMFAAAGTLYVYRSYGIHWCMNVVTGVAGEPAAVLLRGGLPLSGLETMERRRSRRDHLTDGPGKLAQALGVTGVHDGLDLHGGGPVQLLAVEPVSAVVEASPRIGISLATERLWRFRLTTED